MQKLPGIHPSDSPKVLAAQGHRTDDTGIRNPRVWRHLRLRISVNHYQSRSGHAILAMIARLMSSQRRNGFPWIAWFRQGP